MKNPAAVTELISVDWYSEQLPLIPKAELDASAVGFHYKSVDGELASMKSLDARTSRERRSPTWYCSSESVRRLL